MPSTYTMKLTPLDIQQQRFKVRFRGFDVAEVHNFLELVADEFKTLLHENASLKEDLENKLKDIQNYRENEKVLRETMVNAQRIMEELKNNAEKEAQVLISEAELKAEKILSSAHTRLIQIREDISELKRQRTQFETRLRSLIEAHLKLLELDKVENEEQMETAPNASGKD